jgi:hypothetical protein
VLFRERMSAKSAARTQPSDGFEGVQELQSQLLQARLI